MSRIIQERRNRQTGTTVQVVDNRDFMDDNELPWLNVCSEHGGLIGHQTRALAMDFAPVPEEWCPGCQAARDEREES